MKVAVVGGTGVLGKPLVAKLAARDDEVRVLSRGTPRDLPAGASHRRIDLTDGEGLVDALAGIEVVVDASNSNPRNAGPVLVEGTKRLLRAGTEAGVRHHVGVSIVGCDRVPTAYYKVKVEQEEAIAAGGVALEPAARNPVPLAAGLGFGQAARARMRPAGSARLQPVDAGVVAGAWSRRCTPSRPAAWPRSPVPRCAR
jgi:uncharacterized protein YbjT (DUF2867 family)